MNQAVGIILRPQNLLLLGPSTFKGSDRIQLRLPQYVHLEEDETEAV